MKESFGGLYNDLFHDPNQKRRGEDISRSSTEKRSKPKGENVIDVEVVRREDGENGEGEASKRAAEQRAARLDTMRRDSATRDASEIEKVRERIQRIGEEEPTSDDPVRRAAEALYDKRYLNEKYYSNVREEIITRFEGYIAEEMERQRERGTQSEDEMLSAAVNNVEKDVMATKDLNPKVKHAEGLKGTWEGLTLEELREVDHSSLSEPEKALYASIINKKVYEGDIASREESAERKRVELGLDAEGKARFSNFGFSRLGEYVSAKFFGEREYYKIKRGARDLDRIGLPKDRRIFGLNEDDELSFGEYMPLQGDGPVRFRNYIGRGIRGVFEFIDDRSQAQTNFHRALVRRDSSKVGIPKEQGGYGKVRFRDYTSGPFYQYIQDLLLSRENRRLKREKSSDR